MNDFLNMLAERKHRYYHSLYKAKPSAYSKSECTQRLETMIKYEEVITIIDHLPLNEQKIVDSRFDELKSI